MLQNDAWIEVGDLLQGSDFYRSNHGVIFQAIQSLAESKEPFDVVTMGEWLQSRQKLSSIGGIAYLTTLVNNTPSAANIQVYARVVREKSVLRQLITAASDVADLAFRPDGRSKEDILGEAESIVFNIGEREARGKNTFVGIRSLMNKTLDRVQELFETGGGSEGVPTGFTKLDNDFTTSGLQNSDLVIVAGRPSMGKTAFAMNIAQKAAMGEKPVPVAIFSMEMPREQIAFRMLSSLARIDQTKLRKGELTDDDWPRLQSALGIFGEKEVDLFIDDTPSLTPGELVARCRRLKREVDLGLIVIDYLQLMHVSGSSENRATEIAEISRSLKGLAREINCPVIALSQLNRGVDGRQDKRPLMSDLRESGAIEQDADLIMFIYRDEVYNEDTEDKGVAEIIISKHRNGPTGKVKLRFFGEFTTFENMAYESEEREFG